MGTTTSGKAMVEEGQESQSRSPRSQRRRGQMSSYRTHTTGAELEALSPSHRVLLQPHLSGILCSILPLDTLFIARASTRLCHLINEVLLDRIGTIRKQLDTPPRRVSLPNLEDSVARYIHTQYKYGGGQLLCWEGQSFNTSGANQEARYARYHLLHDLLRHWPVLDSDTGGKLVKLEECDVEEF